MTLPPQISGRVTPHCKCPAPIDCGYGIKIAKNNKKKSKDKNMKRNLVLGIGLAAAALLLVTGCSSTSGNMAQGRGAPAVEQKTDAMAASGGVETVGRACSQCGCVHFEALSDNALVCRMCDHSLSNHTRQ
jgi:hypothetical protein